MSAVDGLTDLRVVLGPPGMAAHDSSALDLRTGAGLVDPAAEGLATVSGREDVAQSLILRLLTPRGTLAGLGHAAYGSRLHELLGRHRDDATRALCKGFVLQAVAEEPRVDDTVTDFAFDVASEGPSELRFTLVVRPLGGGDPVVVTARADL